MKRWSRWGIGGMAIYVIGLTAGCFGSLFPQDTSSPAGTTTTIIIVRHAERDPGADPPLNAQGVVRAQALKDALAEQGVTAIYTTDLIRNRDSVQPLADELGLSVNLVSPLLYADTEGTAAVLVDEFLNQHAGGTVLFCGNTGQPEINFVGINANIYYRLGGTGRPPEQYDDLYIAVVPDEGPTRFIKTEYGACSSN